MKNTFTLKELLDLSNAIAEMQPELFNDLAENQEVHPGEKTLKNIMAYSRSLSVFKTTGCGRIGLIMN